MKNPNQELYQTAATVFEEVGFLFIATEPENGKAGHFEAAISVGFSGAAEGRLVLAAYGSILASLSANMLGEDDPPSPKQQEDALGEVTNIICGNVLPKIFNKNDTFRLCAPQTIPSDEFSTCFSKDCLAKAEVPLEEGVVRLALLAESKR